MTSINPYINFKGNCEEAFEFYRSVFGGEFMGERMTYGGVGDIGQPVPDAAKDKIMHMALPIGDSVLMGSDAVEGFGPPVVFGTNFSVAIAPDSKEDADRFFKDLSAGGQPSMPMADAFWGGYFGMLTDKFGVQWLINYDQSKK
jgi:PhnB protein